MLHYPFMVHALQAGTVVAVVAGAVGWFMVLRRQTFAGHTLALIGFPGAAGAVYLGLAANAGFFAFGAVGALVIGSAPRRERGGFSQESAVVGVVQAFALACGVLFASLYRGNLSGTTPLLFGSITGITTGDVAVVAIVGVVAVAALGAIARPLLFASIDPDVAAARGVPVDRLGLGFLLVLGLATGATSQITGALLVFALLVLPAATAQQLTSRPGRGLLTSIGLALAVTWAGLILAYSTDRPIGFFVTTLAFAIYVVVTVLIRWRSR